MFIGSVGRNMMVLAGISIDAVCCRKSIVSLAVLIILLHLEVDDLEL